MFRAAVVLACLFVATIAQAATITAKPGGGRWESGATWDSGTVPTASDDVVLNATSGNVTTRNTQYCRSLDCTGYNGTLTLNAGRQLICGYLVAPTGNYVTLSPTMTLNALTGSVLFCGSPSGPVRGLVTAGQPLQTLKVYNAELLDDVLVGANGLYCYGFFASNDHTIVSSAVRVSGETTAAFFGSSHIATTLFDARTYAVCDVENASLSIGDGMNTVQANGVTFGTVTFKRGQWHEIRGDNSFERLTLSGASAATTLLFQGGSTTTLTGANPLPSGDASGQLSLLGSPNWESGSPSSAWTVSAAIGAVEVEYATIQDSTATGGATFAAGVGSVDGGDNVGWEF